MKKRILLNVIIILFSTNAFAQRIDSLQIIKFRVYNNDVQVSKEKLKSLLSNSPDTSAEFDKYKTKNTIGSAALIVGSGFAIYLGATSLSNSLKDAKNLNDGNLKTSDGKNLILPAAATMGFVSVGAILSLSARGHLIKAVNIYNSKNNRNFTEHRNLKLELTSDGATLIFRF